MSRFNITRKAAAVAMAAPTTNAQGFSFGISRGGLTISHSSGYSRHFGSSNSRHVVNRPVYSSPYSDSHHVERPVDWFVNWTATCITKGSTEHAHATTA